MDGREYCMRKNKLTGIILVWGISILAVVLIAYLRQFAMKFEFGQNYYGHIVEIFANEGYSALLYAALSLTFLTISIISILSDKTVIIYWENITARKLIEPTFRCFYAYTTYAFVLLIAQLAVFFIKMPDLQFIYFILNILDLMCLSMTMIDVYYSREQKKQSLRRELGKICEKSERDDNNIQVQGKIREIDETLKVYTLKAIQETSYDIVQENIELLGWFAPYFDNNNIFFVGNLTGEYLVKSKVLYADLYMSSKGKSFAGFLEEMRKSPTPEAMFEVIKKFDPTEFNADGIVEFMRKVLAECKTVAEIEAVTVQYIRLGYICTYIQFFSSMQNRQTQKSFNYLVNILFENKKYISSLEDEMIISTLESSMEDVMEGGNSGENIKSIPYKKVFQMREIMNSILLECANPWVKLVSMGRSDCTK